MAASACGPAGQHEGRHAGRLGWPSYLGHRHPKPSSPPTFPYPIDTSRNDGRTDYSHDVQVDEKGIAGSLEPAASAVTPRRGRRWGPGREPAPEGKPLGIQSSTRAAGSRNRTCPPGSCTTPSGRSARRTVTSKGASCCTTTGGRPSQVAEDDGVFAIASLDGSYDGQAWRSTPSAPFRLKTVGTWVCRQQRGQFRQRQLLAHYFQIQDDLVVYSWYAQGDSFP